MTTHPTTPPPLDDREKVRGVLHDEGCDPGNSIHGWRCEHPDRYGPCNCLDELADAILAVLNLPARDTRTWWNGYDIGQQDATGVPANGDGTYTHALDHGPRPQEAPDAR